MKVTGVPPHLTLARQLKVAIAAIEDNNCAIRNVQISLNEQVPIMISNKLSENLRENFVIDGVVPITLKDLTAFRRDIVADVTRIVTSTSESASSNNESSINQSESEAENFQYQLFNWMDGKVGHAVPKGWTYPKALTPRMQWMLWHFGDKSSKICPYKRISREHDLVNKGDKMSFTRSKKVMEYLENVIKTHKLLINGANLSNLLISDSKNSSFKH